MSTAIVSRPPVVSTRPSRKPLHPGPETILAAWLISEEYRLNIRRIVQETRDRNPDSMWGASWKLAMRLKREITVAMLLPSPADELNEIAFSVLLRNVKWHVLASKIGQHWHEDAIAEYDAAAEAAEVDCRADEVADEMGDIRHFA